MQEKPTPRVNRGYEIWLCDKFGMDIYTDNRIRYVEMPSCEAKLTHFQRFMKFLKKIWRKIWKYGKKVFTLWNK